MSTVPYHSDAVSARQTEILRRIVTLAHEVAAPVIVMDIDDTIYDVRMREVQVGRAFAKEYDMPVIATMRPEYVRGWDKRQLLAACGVAPEWLDAHFETYMQFWKSHFFSNEFVQYDTPFPYAAAYLQQLHAAGAFIVYITGRDDGMRAGTIAALTRDGFPLPDDRTLLICKDTSNTAIWSADNAEHDRIAATRQADAEFKSRARAHAQQLGSVIASFDNEPVNVNDNFKTFHDPARGGIGFAVQLNTQVAHAEPLVAGAVVIDGFRMG